MSERGNVAHRLNRAESERLRALSNARPNECYLNAYRALILRDLQGDHYVEGVIGSLHIPLPIDHAWIETADGEILDPTMAIHVQTDGETWWPGFYQVGKRFTKQGLRRELARVAGSDERIDLPLTPSLARVIMRDMATRKPPTA